MVKTKKLNLVGFSSSRKNQQSRREWSKAYDKKFIKKKTRYIGTYPCPKCSCIGILQTHYRHNIRTNHTIISGIYIVHVKGTQQKDKPHACYLPRGTHIDLHSISNRLWNPKPNTPHMINTLVV